MPSTTSDLRLPVTADYTEVIDLVSQADEAVEGIVHAVQRIVGNSDDHGYPPERPKGFEKRPTLVDVGALYDFIEGYDMMVDQARRHRKRLDDLLERLNGMRRQWEFEEAGGRG